MNPDESLLRRAVFLGLALAVLGAALLLVAGPGHRFGLWHFSVSFAMMKWAVYLGLAAAAISLLAGTAGFRRGLPVLGCLAAIVLGTVTAWIPWRQLQVARSLPPIHDITTDVEHPPEFSAVVPLREEGSNPLAYGGPELAAQQNSAYPDIAPLTLELPRALAWQRAVVTAQAMGWDVVATDETEGRIEATATTFWFGFKDDVVLRVSAAGDARTRIDVRSVSRVGKGDLGANAQRIRATLAALKDAT